MKDSIMDVCWNCPDRTETCHSNCKKYEEARKLRDARRKQIQEAKAKDRLFTNYALKRHYSDIRNRKK